MPSDMIQNPKKNEHCMAITMRSGKSLLKPTPASIEQEESIERNAEKEVDFEVPIILGRPYLATSRALVDVESGELKFWLNNEEVKFKVCKSMKQPHDMSVLSAIDIVEERVTESSIEERFTVETLVAVIMNFDEDKPTTKPFIEEPHVLELKQLPGHLRYVFLGENKTLLVIMAANLNVEQVQTLVTVLKRFKKAIGWTIADIIGIPPVKCVPKIGGITVVANAKNELIPQRSVIDWRVCMDYSKLNKWTLEDHFPMPFMDQILDRLVGKGWYYFLDGYSGYNQISIALEDQEKTTFACPYGTFAFKHIPFGLCNALATFQRCMISIFSDIVVDTLEVFMDVFSVVGDNVDGCLLNLRRALQICEEANIVLNGKK
ncbi:uncharacterized protein LOC125837573 [Solanum verrucosum]|uniref:uncharacterized protein LOC125837573 n=1 Tax=Solanum verrucosum TaxID=315347 RepID=UPI0020D0FE59|nr:uncharacterized protein LOC125837573 [Solanum verrucosum]